MEPIINSQLPEFKVQAFQNGNFKTVSHEDVKGKWAIFFFYPADFTFVCPTELEDLQNKYPEFLKQDAKFIRSLQILISYTKHGTITLSELVRSHTQCWPIPLMYYVRTLGY